MDTKRKPNPQKHRHQKGGHKQMAKRTQVIGTSKGTSKTKMRMYTTREAQRIVEKNGWTLARTKGDHFYYKKQGNPKILNLSRDLNRMIWERLVKEYDIDLNA